MKYNYSAMGKKSCKIRWARVHSQVRLKNKLSKEKIAIMAYLSGDGYIKVREKSFHYDIQLFLDDLVIAKRAVNLFKKEFGIIPKIRIVPSTVGSGVGYYKVEVSSKPICLHLLSIANYDGLRWSIPKNISKPLLKEWIKCFFDCEAYVNNFASQIQVKSVNCSGLNDIQDKLFLFGINSKVYGPYDNGENHNPYFMLSIYNSEDVRRYNQLIGFYHSRKKRELKSFKSS